MKNIKFLIISLIVHSIIISYLIFENSTFQKTTTNIINIDLTNKFSKNVSNDSYTDNEQNLSERKNYIFPINTLENKSLKKHKVGPITRVFEQSVAVNKKNNVSPSFSKEISRKKNTNDNKKKTGKNKSEEFISKATYKIGSKNNPHPPYPLIARKRGFEGNLILKVYVNKTGYVDRINLKKSSGFKILDNISIETISKWYFTPAKQNGNNVKDKLEIPIKFVLNN